MVTWFHISQNILEWISDLWWHLLWNDSSRFWRWWPLSSPFSQKHPWDPSWLGFILQELKWASIHIHSSIKPSFQCHVTRIQDCPSYICLFVFPVWFSNVSLFKDSRCRVCRRSPLSSHSLTSAALVTQSNCSFWLNLSTFLHWKKIIDLHGIVKYFLAPRLFLCHSGEEAFGLLDNININSNLKPNS